MINDVYVDFYHKYTKYFGKKWQNAIKDTKIGDFC